MTHISDVYYPEHVELLDECLDEVCHTAARYREVDPSLREAFATALLEASRRLEHRDELVAFALRVLPHFRDRSG